MNVPHPCEKERNRLALSVGGSSRSSVARAVPYGVVCGLALGRLMTNARLYLVWRTYEILSIPLLVAPKASPDVLELSLDLLRHCTILLVLRTRT